MAERQEQRRGRRLGLVALGALVSAMGCAEVIGADWSGYEVPGGQGGAGAQGGGSVVGGGGAGGEGAGGGGTGASGGGGGGAGGSIVCGADRNAPAVPPPSCAGGAPGAGDSCGVSGNVDCCDNKVVPCGSYFRTYGPDASDIKVHPATVSDFRLDTFEITVGRFRAFVNAGKGTMADPPAAGAGEHPKIDGSGWNTAWNTSLVANTQVLDATLHCSPEHETWTSAPGPNESLPMTCMTWFEAFAFCVWDEGRLPTEAEWGRAAAGGDEHREFPWGSGIDDSKAVFGCLPAQCPDGTLPPVVGSKSPAGDGKWGHADLAGSVEERTLDWYFESYSFDQDCTDCAALTGGTVRVRRGGGFIHGAGTLRSALRASQGVGSEGARYYHVGARCARQP